VGIVHLLGLSHGHSVCNLLLKRGWERERATGGQMMVVGMRVMVVMVRRGCLWL
jgi:hypothetical protein